MNCTPKVRQKTFGVQFILAQPPFVIDYDKNEVLDILKKNLVCSDFFEWDFENWCKK